MGLNEVADKKQYEFMSLAKPRFLSWATSQNINIFRFDFITGWGIGLGIYIFYKSESELKKYTENGIIEKTKQEFFQILTEIGYIKEFNNNVRFEFDSDENVKKNFKGNYFFRLR